MAFGWFESAVRRKGIDWRCAGRRGDFEKPCRLTETVHSDSRVLDRKKKENRIPL